MNCNFCKKKEAVLSAEHIFDGLYKKIYLCKDCATKIGLDTKSHEIDISITNLVKGKKNLTGLKDKGTVLCQNCGKSLTDIILNKKIACINCLSVFEKEITNILNAKTTDWKYKGQIPLNASKDFDKAITVIKLKQKLKQAVDNEEYELAAVFRDDLKKLESKDA